MPRHFVVPMMTNRAQGTLYVGVTSDLPARVRRRRTNAANGFTKRYNGRRLVWFEPHADAENATCAESA